MKPVTVYPVLASSHARIVAADGLAQRRSGRVDRAVHAARSARHALERTVGVEGLGS